jgi:murein DD-endopeptidase MepM/ murein hydrolase activator NlpD
MMSERGMGARSSSRWALAAAASAALALALAAPLAGHGRRTADAPRSTPTRRPVWTLAQTLVVEMHPRESLAAALERGGVDAGEAAGVATALAEDFDIVNPHPGLTLDMALGVTPGDSRPRLVRLSFKPSDERQVIAWRNADGALEVQDVQSAVVATPSRIEGVVDGSLYLSMVDAGVDADAAAHIVGLFGRGIDLSRDVESGDRFALVFEQTRSSDGAAAGEKTLLYGEVAGRAGRARLYRFQPGGGGPADYLDGQDGPSRALLLRTPVDGARVTSAFGLRLHPILGFTRMHQGVDFGAAEGAPVLAAGDGVVEEARWSGGYGRWLKLRHAQGLETGYAHLSAWASGIAPGVSVRQGEVVGFVGATGLATGPHLHYEVFLSGRRIDPRLAKTASAGGADPAARAAFRAQRARIDGLQEVGGAQAWAAGAQAMVGTS